MFRLLAVCHTVVIEKDPRHGNIHYQAASPDELALVSGAKQVGLTLHERNSKNMLIQNEHTGQTEDYEILAEIPFDSTRKRMSLLVKYQGEIMLMCKGADSIMLPRCAFVTEADQVSLSRLTADLLTFAKEGLRTLVVAQKTLSEIEYYRFDSELHRIKTSTDPDKEAQLDVLYNDIERGLQYVGATAIEDKLQYGVPETIAMLIKAKIKVWVLTGDKQETAIEIGKSCKLIQPDMSLEILSSATEDEFREKLLDLISKYGIELKKEGMSIKEAEAR